MDRLAQILLESENVIVEREDKEKFMDYLENNFKLQAQIDYIMIKTKDDKICFSKEFY